MRSGWPIETDGIIHASADAAGGWQETNPARLGSARHAAGLQGGPGGAQSSATHEAAD